MANQRKFVVGGNWKMNGDKQSIDGIIAFLNKGPLNDETGKNAIYIHRSLCYRYKPFTVSCESTTYF